MGLGWGHLHPVTQAAHSTLSFLGFGQPEELMWCLVLLPIP